MNALESHSSQAATPLFADVTHDHAASAILLAIGIILSRSRQHDNLSPRELKQLAYRTFPSLQDGGSNSQNNDDSTLVNQLQAMQSHELITRLSVWYEHKLTKDAVEKEGAFYTPPALAKMMVERALSRFSSSPKAILDPVVGSGIFLTEIYNVLANQKNVNAKEALSSLHATDINGQALSFSQILIQLSALLHKMPLKESSPIVERHFVTGDSLVCPEAMKRISEPLIPKNALCIEQTFRELFEKNGGVDLIIGNPPYGLSREARLDHAYTNVLKNLYRGRFRGRINTYLLFIIRAYELLANGGYLSFVVPNAWLGIDEALPVREMLLREGALCEIDTFNRSPFGSLGVEVICFSARKSASQESIEIRTFDNCEASRPISITSLSTDEIMRDRSVRISIKSSQSDNDFLRAIEACSVPLNEASAGLKASIALQVYAVGRGEPKQTKEVVRTHPFHVDSPLDQSCIPYLEGRDISPFHIASQPLYLRYGEWMAEFHPRERYASPRILVREILGRYPRLITASYTALPYAYNRSVLHIHATHDPDGEILRALTVLLNSPIASYWLFHRGRKSQRTKFPKILARDLNEFPIPRSIEKPEVRHALLSVYEERLKSKNADTRIAELVSDIYGVTVPQ